MGFLIREVRYHHGIDGNKEGIAVRIPEWRRDGWLRKS